MHYSVLLRESLELLKLRGDGVYADLTAGLGGHTKAIALRLLEMGGAGWVLACDRDAESLELARQNLGRDVMANAQMGELSSKVHFRQALFSQVEEVLASMEDAHSGVGRAEGLSLERGPQLDGVL